MVGREDWVARAEHEFERHGEDPAAAARAQAYLLRALVEQLRQLNEQIADLRRLQKQTRDRTF